MNRERIMYVESDESISQKDLIVITATREKEEGRV